MPVTDEDPEEITSWKDWLSKNTINAVLSISTDISILTAIKAGYRIDEFCSKFVSGEMILPNVKEINGLWYIGDRLLIPHTGTI